MQKLIWTNANGDSVDLTKSPYGITNWEGFSNTSLNIQSQQVPFQDGGVFLDALIEQRELAVTLAIYDGNNLETRYRLRRELIHALNPKLGEGYLIYTNDFTSKRIKCVPQIPLFETHNSNDSGTPKASLAWTACEPYWEDVEANSKTLSLDVIETVVNEGEVPTEMEVDFFVSQSTNPKIQNLTTGKKIQLDGTFDDNINININLGKKTVTTNKTVFDYSNISLPEKLFYSEAFQLYILIANTGNGVYTSKDGKRWKVIFYSQEESAHNVFCTNSSIIVYTNNMDLVTTDGENWVEKEESEITRGITKVCYSKTLNKYYGIGGKIIYESSNAINFQQVYSLTGNYQDLYAKDICCSNNLICVVGGIYNNLGEFSRRIATSSDGTTWNEIIVDEDCYSAVTYSKELNLFCAVGYYGIISTSSDGTTWNNTKIQNENNEDIEGYLYAESLSGARAIFICTNVYLYKSMNGINWEQVIVSGNVEEYGSLSIANYSLFVEIMTDDYRQNMLLKSTNGEDWNDFIDGHIMYNIAYSKKLGIYCGYRGDQYGGNAYIYYSYDCIHWNIGYAQEAWYGYNDICYSEKIGMFFIAIADTYIYSTDGIHWQSKYYTDSITQRIPANKMCVSEKLGIVIAYMTNSTSDYILISYDGLNWQEQGIEYNGEERLYPLEKICYLEKLSLFCGLFTEQYDGYGSAISLDGIHWTYQEIDSDSEHITELGFICKSENLGMFISVGYNISYSIDGLNWTKVMEITSIESAKLQSATYSEELGLFCAVGTEKILVSPDGINWKNKWEQGKGFYYDYVTYLEALDAFFISFFSIGNGVIITSNETTSNIISALSTDSDMSLELVVGQNELLLTQDSGGLSGRVTYRQKYIGV